MRLNDPVASIRRSRTIAAELHPSGTFSPTSVAISAWVPSVDHSCVPEHEPVSRRIQVGRTVVVERITDFAPPNRLGYDIEGLPRQLRRVHAQWQLLPSGRHTLAALTYTVDIGSNPAARLAERGVCRCWHGSAR